MGRTRNIAIVAGASVLGIGLTAAWLGVTFPIAQGAVLHPRDGIVGVDTGGAYVWVVRTDAGAILVDSGLDPHAEAIHKVLTDWGLTGDDVHAIVLTHAHGDHILGLNAFPKAQILVDETDRSLLLQQRSLSKGVPTFAAWVMGAPLPTQDPTAIERGTPFTLDNRTLTPHHVPGHTLGSTAYVMDDVLFSGDAVVSAPEGVMVLPSFISEDHVQMLASLHALVDLEVTTMLDGHAGITDAPTAKIAAFLRQ